MKTPIIASFFAVSAMWAQPPAAVPPSTLPPETVVARIDGKPVTAGELMMFLQVNPPEAQKNFLQNGQAFIERLALVRRLAEMAVKEKLDQQPEVKLSLELFRMNTLANAEVSAAQDNIPIAAEDQKKFYEAHRDRYTQAKVKMLYISFRSNAPATADPNAKKYLSEEQAKAKIEKLRADIQGGADFVKVVKENSDDADSVARNGDFETPIHRTDKWPDYIKNAIFALKPGQVSDPLRTTSGYYLFRLEELGLQPYDQVSSEIFMEIRQQRFNAWLEKTRKSLDVKIENPDFFKVPTAGAGGAN
jgi:peptidyl-prolyl cis-trans isomerase C